MTEGFLYVAIGKKYRTLAAESIVRLRQFYPDTPVHVISDEPMDGPAPFTCAVKNSYPRTSGARNYAFHLRSIANQLTPFDVTMWLDCDSVVVRNFGSLADVLGPAAFGAVRYDSLYRPTKWGSPSQFLPPVETKYIDLVEKCSPPNPYFMAGTVVFHRERAAPLFKVWTREHSFCYKVGIYGYCPEEASLRLAITQTPLMVAELCSLFNWCGPIGGQYEPYIVHGLREAERRAALGFEAQAVPA